MKEESFFLILHVFIAFERCFIHSIKEHLSVLLSSERQFTYHKSIYQLLTESRRISWE